MRGIFNRKSRLRNTVYALGLKLFPSALVGITSERDYARRVILQGKSSNETHVKHIMTSPVVYVTPCYTPDGCHGIMTNFRVRHLPVLIDKDVVGVVSIGDLDEMDHLGGGRDDPAARALHHRKLPV